MNFLQWKLNRANACCVSITKADVIVFSLVSIILELRDDLGKNAGFVLPVSSGFMSCCSNITFKLQYKTYRRNHPSYALNFMKTEYSSMHPNSSVHCRIYEQEWQRGERKMYFSTKLTCFKNCRELKWTCKYSEHKTKKLKLSFYS